MGLKSWLKRDIAIMKNDDGDTIGKKKFKITEEKFTYNDGTYNIIRNSAFRFEKNGFFFKSHYYFYNIGNPNPLKFNSVAKLFEPVIAPKLYKKMLDNEVLIALNTVQGGLFKNIKPLHIIIGLIVIGVVIYYVQTKGAP